MAGADAIAACRARFPELGEARPLVTHLDGRASDQLALHVPPGRLLEVMRFLYDDPRCRFEQLCDLTAIDYLNYPAAGPLGAIADRFGVIYALLSVTLNHRLWVKVFVSDPTPTVPSVTGIWKGAEWPEREVFDMFGIVFTDHPDLRRILMPVNFTAFPLRKDYPVSGRGERDSLERVTRESA
jgi:NADH-quinone oxidoreductase subunit C